MSTGAADSARFDELHARGRQELKNGKLAEALAAFEEARQIDDLNADLHEAIATAHYMTGAIPEALTHFERVTRLAPARGPAWINLGAVYNKAGEYQKAVDVLRRAVQMEKKSSAAFFNLGVAYRHLKQWSLAIPAYREAIRLDGKMVDAYLNLGNVYFEMGNYVQAISQYKHALQINPEFEKAQRALKNAEEARDASKQPSLPFGRLVDPEKAATAAPAEIAYRELTDAERKKDRDTLHELGEQIDSCRFDLVEQLREGLEPALRTLNRLLTQPPSPLGESLTRADALEQFELACNEFEPLKTVFQEAVRQLRDHEASVT
jgi:Tfp pilus assembly protein PilF